MIPKMVKMTFVRLIAERHDLDWEIEVSEYADTVSLVKETVFISVYNTYCDLNHHASELGSSFNLTAAEARNLIRKIDKTQT